MSSKGTILSGMRPTGKLHIGHLSVLDNWVRLQNEYRCFFTIVDWHALTTSFEESEAIKENIWNMALDWLSVGIDPEKSTIFVQSHVPGHAELHLAFSMITPLSWLERVPTYKEQVAQLDKEGKDIRTYGFLGYPLLQAADILVYKADTVPVGEDQLPHLELTREVARRFNFLYKTDLFPEPQAKLAEVSLLPGVDGRKMSKSYHNDIAIDAGTDEIKEKVRKMVTDPARIHKDDPGHPEVCIVYAYQKMYNSLEVEDITERCRKGEIGCGACKQVLAKKLDENLSPIREKREQFAANPTQVKEILTAGEENARKVSMQTMKEVRDALGI